MFRASLSAWFWWWPLLSAHRGPLLQGIAASAVCSLASAWVPYWAGRAVEALELRQWSLSRRHLGVMLAVTAVAGVSRYLMRNQLIGLSRQAERRQRESLYAFLLSRPQRFFERQRVGDLMARVGDDVGTVRMATGPGLMSLLQTASLLPATLALMIHASPSMTAAVFAPFILLAGGFYIIGRWSHALQARIQLANSALSTFSHETISGEKVVQAFGLETLRADRFREMGRQLAALQVKQAAVMGAYGPLSMLMGGLAAMILVVHGGQRVMDGRLSLGDLTAFTGYLAALSWPVMSVGWSLNLFQRARAGMERIQQILDDPGPALDAPAPMPPALAPPALTLKDVAHRFPDGRSLGPLSLRLEPGDSLAVLGGIGSGKSVLLQVLAGLRQPTEGIFQVDGAVLDAARLRAHWAGLGWVPQEAFLFSSTLRENLAFGRPEATEAELWEVVRVVCLEGLLGRLPEGLDTVVGERGVILSGGERQRAALGRALLRRPGLLLLDDALSAVDAETEARILDNLRTHLGPTTLVLATHRVFVAELCARALVLDEGRVVQAGRPRDLAAEPGPYARLRQLQSLERELAGTHRPAADLS